MAEPKGFPSLKVFLESITSAKPEAFVGRPERKVAHERAFSEMQAHILRLYEKTEALHSFMDESGAVWDCIPVEQQPALRGARRKVPAAPDAPRIEPGEGPKGRRKTLRAVSPLGPEKKDQFGNVMNCPESTIPMRRVTLEDLSRFGTLRDFFRKGPRGAGRPPRVIEPQTVPATHRWAHAYQNVSNGGAHSVMSLWNPPVNLSQVFSLSQIWIVGGSGANLQTVECGWQVYPTFYGDFLPWLKQKPHLFTYYTADDYSTTGCYNMTCNAFVQISPYFAPGMALGSTSTIGGSQYIMELAYWHTGGCWWLYYNGTSGSNAIGYYPDTLFKGGALAGNASEIDFGGETVGYTTFPPMGSGRFANEGWLKAAFQHSLGYWKPQGGAMVKASLTASQGWPSCYTAKVEMSGDPWYETLWYGGPGGTC